MLDAASEPFDAVSVRAGDQTPVFFGSAPNNFGLQLLLDAFLEHAPPPQPLQTAAGEVAPTHPRFSGFIFKIQSNMDPKHLDQIAFLRVCSGRFARDMKVVHARTDKTVRLDARAAARRRGLGRAQRVVFLGDGSAWVWEIARDCFAGAIQILDLYHALERLHALCEGVYGTDGLWARTMEQRWSEQLRDDQIAEVLTSARRRLESLGVGAPETLGKQIAYFENHQERMRYKTYREAGLFLGSGVVEAGCKTVIGQRLKQAGMFWTESGATSVLTLRCALKSNRWDECWDRAHHSDHLKTRLAA